MKKLKTKGSDANCYVYFHDKGKSINDNRVCVEYPVRNSLLLLMPNSVMKLDNETRKVLGYKGNYLTFLRHYNRRTNNKRDNARRNPQLVFEELCRALQTKKEG